MLQVQDPLLIVKGSPHCSVFSASMMEECGEDRAQRCPSYPVILPETRPAPVANLYFCSFAEQGPVLVVSRCLQADPGSSRLHPGKP